ncbi:hypothetical protein SAMN05216532_8091 [Streptomyces sp. 2231.1]|uniref:hypothetical protein n=1 Tax=Streptomyces sp. 2231.1 TaxID=1855347 RepID=UPI00089D2394|nr:hypothetical protein [Streptomyces sp. 2231.1]SEE39920.1 hypothetical protein SAMN05216532_8091 [Streptomyces sp. 2231.1]
MDRPGRRRKDLAVELPEPVRLWAATLRSTVFGPMQSGKGRLTLKKIADRLEAMAPEEPDESSRPLPAFLLSGRGVTSVQRMQSGQLVPTRDVVYDLLKLMAEVGFAERAGGTAAVGGTHAGAAGEAA